jgi:hypothetical protein
VTEASDNKDRDAQGRFAQGNRGGPGGSRRQSSELRRAAEEAVTPEHVQALMRKALRMGLEGNLPAMRLVLERACGRPAETPTAGEPLSIELPRLTTVADCNRAIEKVIDAVVKGTVDREATKLLIEAIQVRIKAIEVGEQEERLAQVEQAAANLSPRKP